MSYVVPSPATSAIPSIISRPWRQPQPGALDTWGEPHKSVETNTNTHKKHHTHIQLQQRGSVSRKERQKEGLRFAHVVVDQERERERDPRQPNKSHTHTNPFCEIKQGQLQASEAQGPSTVEYARAGAGGIERG